MIVVENLTKVYGDVTVLKNISFNVNSEIYGLLGPNGSGKSTLMRIIVGITKPTSGKVVVDGIDVIENPVKVKEIVGYVPETPTLYESLTPGELFDFVGKVRGIPKNELERTVSKFVRAFELEEYMDQFIGTLSFGTRQKVSVIAALLHNPKVLILDEAMNGLDAKTAKIFRELLFEFKKDRSIIFSTHILPLAELICDRIGVIYEGKIIAEGTIDELKQQAEEGTLEDVFLKLTKSRDEIDEIIAELGVR